MKVTRLEAAKVHGFLPIRIEFFPDLTFLTGLNGSGKTTALRLLMGLLAPNLDELIDISFTSASATVSDGAQTTTLQALRTPDELLLTSSDVQEKLSLSTAELQLLVEARRHREEAQIPLYDKIRANPVYQSIWKMSTPMFLGLDRRLYVESTDRERVHRLRFREMELRGFADVPTRRVDVAALGDVNELVENALSRIRTAQERLDADLRNKILLDSFRYETTEDAKVPDRRTLEQFRARLAAVEKAAAGLKLPAGLLESALADFVERMTNVVDAVEKGSQEAGQKGISLAKLSSRGQKRGESGIDSWNSVLLEWVMNARQAHRIFKQVELFEEYVASRLKLHEPIDRFLQLTNGFLIETNKTVKVADQGALRVR